MPLACLLGRGDKRLTEDFGNVPALKPEHVCLIGIRSFEPAEKELLDDMNVRVFYMDDLRERGLNVVMNEAIKIAEKAEKFGVCIDLDAIDPSEAPGVGTPEESGIAAVDLIQNCQQLRGHSQFCGAEIVEFNPSLDQEQKTEKIIVELVKSFF